MKRAPISCCFIVRDDPKIVQAIASVRPWVEEIVVVQTKCGEPTLQDVDTLQTFTGCNDADGLIEDFALARNHALALARHPWMMWLDSDDELTGGEHLLDLTRRATRGPVLYELPYEYDHDALGRPSLFQTRERLVSPPSAFQWVDAVHETLIPKGDVTRLDDSRVVVKHRRTTFDTTARNLRILLKKGGSK